MENSTISLEQRVRLLEDAKEFANYVTTKYPQVNEKGELNYYLSGSLLVMLLSQINEFEVLDYSKIPEIKIIQKKEIKPELSDKLKSFARKIGDLDYIETSAYKQLKSEIPDEYLNNEGYVQEKNKFLPFGGESFSLEELPVSLRENLFVSGKGNQIFCDSVKEYDKMEVAKINLGDKGCFITNPLNFFGCKFLSTLQKLPKKAESLKRDFSILLPTFSELYSEEELIHSTYNLLQNFQKAKSEEPNLIKSYFKKVENNLLFNFDSNSRNLKYFLIKVKNYDLVKGDLF